MTATQAEPPVPAARGKIWQKLVLSLLPAAAIVWLMQSGSLKIVPPSEELARVAPATIPAYIAVWLAMYFVRLARWYWLLAPVQRVPLRTVLRVGAVGLLAVALLPFRMGEVVRPLLIRRRPKLTFWAASGTVGGERIIDAFSVSVMLLVGLHIAKPQANLPDHIGTLPVHVDLVPRTAFVSALVFATGCVVMGVFYFQRAWARRMTELVIGVVSRRAATFVATKLEQMAEGLGFLSDPKLSIPFVLATVAYWSLNAATFYVLALGCGLGDIGYWGAAATMGVVALGILVPATPGFFGMFQLATYAGLAMYLTPDVVMGRGSAYAFLGYVLPIGLSVVTGVAAMLAEPRALLLLTGAPEASEVPARNLAEPGAPS
jgi:glycosyltransferase 2 family protein